MTKLLPFDLEAAKAGAKVVTRDGRPARIVCWDGEARSGDAIYPLVALIGIGRYQYAALYSDGGTLYSDGGTALSSPPSLDLFMAPTPVKRWRVIYRGADDNAAQRDFEQYADASNFWRENEFSEKPFTVEVTP